MYQLITNNIQTYQLFKIYVKTSTLIQKVFNYNNSLYTILNITIIFQIVMTNINFFTQKIFSHQLLLIQHLTLFRTIKRRTYDSKEE